MASFTQVGRLFGREREAVSRTPEPRERMRASGLARAVTMVKRLQDNKDYVYALSIATRMEAEQTQQQERSSNLSKIVRFIAVKAVNAVAKHLVLSLARAVIRTSVRLALRGLMFIGKRIFSWVVRPLISGIVTVIAANPITSLLVIGGAAGYMVWREFFSDKGKAKRAAEAATMPEAEEQPSITGQGAAGAATPQMKANARATLPQREAAAPVPTAEQASALGRTTQLVNRSATPPKLGTHKLGDTSRAYESNGNPGTVSTGKGDYGGISYGLYQLSSKQGSVHAYLKWSRKYGPMFQGLEINSPAFIDKWKAVARADPQGFAQDQHDYAQTVYYDQGMRQAARLGWNFDSRGPAIHDMVWSTSVQHGSLGPIKTALKGQDVSKLTDAQIIELVQNYKYENAEKLFKSSPKLWPGLKKRALSEKASLLALDAEWQKRKQEQSTGTVSVAEQKVESKPIAPTERPKIATAAPTSTPTQTTMVSADQTRGTPVKIGNKLVSITE